MLKCTDCCYYWKNADDERPHCNWTSRCPDDIPPCEDDYYLDDDYNDDGNMPCDYSGMCAGTSCSQYWNCNGGK